MFLDDYNLADLTEDLKKILRVQDWDIEFTICNAVEMGHVNGGDYEYSGLCSINRRIKKAWIYLNKDLCEDDEDWLNTIIHEILHITSDDFIFMVYSLFDYIKDENTAGKEQDNIEVWYERTNHEIAKIITGILGENYLNKFKLKKGDKNHEKSK